MIYIGKKKPDYYNGILIKADKSLHNNIIEEIKNLNLHPEAKILDMGCGEGALSQRLLDMGYDVLSVDMTEKDFKSDANFFKLDFNNKLDVEKFVEKFQNNFDVVLGIEVIEHVENHWEYVRTLKSLVHKNGYILISSPNVTSWMSRLYFLFYGRHHQFMESDLRYGHINPISSWQVEYIFKELNIDLIGIKPAGTLPMFYFPNISIKSISMNIFSMIFTPIMRELGGTKFGWCIIAIGRKND